jgi:chromate reductase
MSGITIFSGTNRNDSHTLKVSLSYQQLLENKGIQATLLSFQDLPHDITFNEVFGKRSAGFSEIITKYVDNSDKFIFVVPEYNGSFPGIVKVFLDAIHPKHWTDKKAALVGVSQGRAGNLRGIEQLSMILNYLKIHVYHNKLPVSTVDKVVGESGLITNPDTIAALERQIDGFLKF